MIGSKPRMKGLNLILAKTVPMHGITFAKYKFLTQAITIQIKNNHASIPLVKIK